MWSILKHPLHLEVPQQLVLAGQASQPFGRSLAHIQQLADPESICRLLNCRQQIECKEKPATSPDLQDVQDLYNRRSLRHVGPGRPVITIGAMSAPPAVNKGSQGILALP